MTTNPKPREEIKAITRLAIETKLKQRNKAEALAVAILWYLGLRISETLKLRWPMINLDRTTRPLLTLPPAITKNNVGRQLPIPLPLARRLENYLEDDAGTPPLLPPTDHVITHRRTNKPLTPRAVQYALTSACRKLELPHLSPHSFRHSFATRMLRNSNIKLTQLALGHKSITTTALYTHPTLDELETAITKAALED